MHYKKYIFQKYPVLAKAKTTFYFFLVFDKLISVYISL